MDTLKRTIIFASLLFFFGCKKDEWIGIVYPNRNNLNDHRVIGSFSDLDKCLQAVNRKAGARGSYECAKNCDKSQMPMVCEETIGNEK